MKNEIQSFRFVAYLSPPQKNVYKKFKNKNYITRKHYNNMKDCGFLYAIGLFEDSNPKYFVKAMKMAKKTGIRYMVKDPFKNGSFETIINDTSINSNPEQLLEKYSKMLKKRFDKYYTFNSYSGVLAADEPSSQKNEVIQLLKEWYQKNYPDTDFIVNLLPTYANSEQLTGKADAAYDYEKYVKDFTETVQPDILSYDHYALIKGKDGTLSVRQDYLLNLEIIAEQAKEKSIPFFVFLQTLGHFSFRTPETYADIAWQVYTSMAFGAKGAQTFTYWTLLGNHENDNTNITHGVVGQKGELTDEYFACKEVIKEVRSFEKVYLAAKWKGVMYVNADENKPNKMFLKLKNPVKSHSSINKIICSKDCIIGLFEYESKDAFLIADATDPAEKDCCMISVDFNSVKMAEIYIGTEKNVKDVQNRTVKISLKAGQGCFIVLS